MENYDASKVENIEKKTMFKVFEEQENNKRYKL